MPKVVTATELKNRLGTIMEWVQDNQDEVIVESRGEPRAVIMSFTEYEKIEAIRRQARRREAFARLEQVRQRVQARNTDLSEEEAEALADRFTREVFEEMTEEGKLHIQRDG